MDTDAIFTHAHRPVSIALISLMPPYTPSNSEPLSIECLAGSLDNIGHVKVDCALYDQQHSTNKAITDSLLDRRPIDILGVSIPRGAFSTAKQLVDDCRKSGIDFSLLVFGGAMPTMSPSQILRQFPESIAVQGFGEPSIVGLAERVTCRKPLSEIPNLAYYDESSRLTETRFVETDLLQLPLPRRDLLPQILSSGGIVNAETSRNCTFAATKSSCTFCVRDPRYKQARKRESFARGTTERAMADIEQMTQAGVRNIGYVDEEFIGHDHVFARDFGESIIKRNYKINYFLSARIDSIWSPTEAAEESRLRELALSTLRRSGLRKIFIGLESASDSQLRRYHKGYRSRDIMNAFDRIQKLGIEPDIGFIMFDPLVTIDELRENIDFLYTTGLLKYTTSIVNLMNVSEGNSYCRIVRLAEQRNDLSLLGKLNHDTLEYECRFLHSEVNWIYRNAVGWERRTYKLVYALKTMTRGNFSSAGSDPRLHNTKAYLKRLRLLELHYLHDVVHSVAEPGDRLLEITESYRRQLDRLISEVAKSLASRQLLDGAHLIRKSLDEYYFSPARAQM